MQRLVGPSTGGAPVSVFVSSGADGRILTRHRTYVGHVARHSVELYHTSCGVNKLFLQGC